ncbi:MAG: GyrI-like domain-containing protein [Dehalococcoidia bacterium]|nr:GyrI-like domain-containing protein [Dehalococcoidia bacterium]
MTCKATIVDLPDIQLMVSRAEEFPGGIKGAWDTLESRLASLKGRKFYGLTLCEGPQLAYFAGVVPVSDEEVSSLGLPTMIIKGGKYARAKLFDWSDHTDEIGKVFDELMREFRMDPNGHSVEYYRSQSELHLLIPLATPSA